MPPLQTMEAKFVPKDTREFLGKLLVKDCSRSLYFDRYARPAAVREDRQAFFTEGFKTHTDLVRLRSWAVASGAIAKCGVRFYAQLQSRLMVNMSGGVMENAGLCLDRYGLPYIPGSAVKGCARRAALAALNEWCETSKKPSGTDNLFSRACESFAEPFDMLAAIARVFGWCEQDWLDNSDFAWATGKRPDALSKAAVALAGSSGRTMAPEQAGTPWKSLPNSAGGVAFLSAHPVELPKGTDIQGMKTPAVGELELDVVTCHHPEYYQGERMVATDDEDPNPVVFPAVAAGHVFGFVLRRLRCVEGDLRHAEAWLRCGLGTFGLGAKTAAGYGWFDCSEAVGNAVSESIQRRVEREKRAAEEAAAKAKAEAEAKAKEEEKEKLRAALEGLTGEDLANKQVELMTKEQFWSKVQAFHKESKKGGPLDEHRKALVRALRGARLDVWKQFKEKAKSGDLAKAADAIRSLSKQMYTGNEGRMP